MNTKHTPKHLNERLALHPKFGTPCIGYDCGDGGELLPICPVVQGFDQKQAKANARRLVACWNACAGINPAAVPDLLDALKFFVECFGPTQAEYVFSKRVAIDKARDAITKAGA